MFREVIPIGKPGYYINLSNFEINLCEVFLNGNALSTGYLNKTFLKFQTDFEIDFSDFGIRNYKIRRRISSSLV